MASRPVRERAVDDPADPLAHASRRAGRAYPAGRSAEGREAVGVTGHGHVDVDAQPPGPLFDGIDPELVQLGLAHDRRQPVGALRLKHVEGDELGEIQRAPILGSALAPVNSLWEIIDKSSSCRVAAVRRLPSPMLPERWSWIWSRDRGWA
jgi:hypothetical protein